MLVFMIKDTLDASVFYSLTLCNWISIFTAVNAINPGELGSHSQMSEKSVNITPNTKVGGC